jgi:2-phospho-L-lactate guanylyltransferase
LPLDAIIPFKPRNPKTRLAGLLDRQERESFARAMLRDVVGAVTGAGCRPVLLCTAPSDDLPKATVFIDPRGLNEALNDLFRHRSLPLLLIMSDLPLATSESVGRLIGGDRDIVIAPGRGGGTNALFLKYPEKFRADFYGTSFLKHCKIAQESGCSWDVADSFRLHTDVDEEDDLVEVLIHGGRESRDFLSSAGFSLSVDDGRVGVKRHPHK